MSYYPFIAAAACLVISALTFFLERSLARARAADARKAAMLASSLDCIISMDHRGRVIEWNAAAERAFGWTRRDALGKEMASLIIPPQYREAHRRGLERYLRSGEGPVLGRRIEISGLRADGTEFPVELAITRIQSEEPPVFTAFLRDITERRQRERAAGFLADLNAATQTLSDPDEIMAMTARLLRAHLDVDRCAYAQVEDENIFVITGDATRNVPSIVGHWPVAAFGPACVQMMRENKPYIVVDTDADERIRPEDLPAYRATTIRAVICVPMHKEGKFTAAMAVHQTAPRQWRRDEIELVETVVGRCWESLERARAMHDLVQAAEDLRRSNQELEQFAYVSSHDLQEPLRKIINYGERLQALVKGEAEKDYLERMKAGCYRMKSVIVDLLRYSRISKEKELAIEDVDVQKLLEEVKTDLELKINDSKATIVVEEWCPLRGNASQLRHLFQNLLTNSLKFARKDVPPVVRVSCRNDGRQTEIRIQDNGIGFDEKYAEKIFQPFQRLHGSSEYEGTGIGLSIVRKIVENHRGRISVRSTLGEGTVFEILLPFTPNTLGS
jgi:PAS domain S-box-containing protein